MNCQESLWTYSSFQSLDKGQTIYDLHWGERAASLFPLALTPSVQRAQPSEKPQYEDCLLLSRDPDPIWGSLPHLGAVSWARVRCQP